MHALPTLYLYAAPADCVKMKEVAISWIQKHGNAIKKLEIAAQVIAQCKVSATRVVADAALWRIG